MESISKTNEIHYTDKELSEKVYNIDVFLNNNEDSKLKYESIYLEPLMNRKKQIKKLENKEKRNKKLEEEKEKKFKENELNKKNNLENKEKLTEENIEIKKLKRKILM